MNSSKTVKPTLVFVLSRFPFPLEKGDKLRAYNQIVGLSKTFSITLICTTEETITVENQREIEKYCDEIHVFKLNKIVQLVHLFLCIFTNKPFQVAYFWQFNIHQKIKKIIKKTQPDFIFSQLIRTTEYVKNYHSCPKIIDYMDAFSKGMERRAALQSTFLKPIFVIEYERLKKYEHYIFDYFDEHLIISEQDRSFIIHPKSKEIVIIKNGVSESFFNSIPKEIKYDIAFIGNMNYPPNVMACEYLIKQIKPLISTDIKILISGANPAKSILKLATKNIEIPGWVSDIRDSYLQSKIFVAPIFLGSGLQNKLLEAMVLGIPCITTTLANTALGAEPEHSILIANTPEEFKTQIERLLGDETLYSKIKSGGELFVKEHFSWNNLNEQLGDLIVNSRNKMMN